MPGAADDYFILFEDDRSIRGKIAFARQHGLGEVIIWELGGGWLGDQQGSPLLEDVKSAVATVSAP